MNTSTDPSFASLQLGAAQVRRNIVVFPIIGPMHAAGRWLTVGEALEQQFLAVIELSHGGSVPELAVINRAERPLLWHHERGATGARDHGSTLCPTLPVHRIANLD